MQNCRDGIEEYVATIRVYRRADLDNARTDCQNPIDRLASIIAIPRVFWKSHSIAHEWRLTRSGDVSLEVIWGSHEIV
jgi:hypothetical protein